jgi:pyridinium-3,5-bisthiocarboxylic acid mononucleotide nickel chelatase
MDSGALDAFVTPIQMKKNRPGVMVSVLCDETKIAALEAVLFRETATLGIRRYPVSRHKLKRQSCDVETPFGPVRGKLGWLDDRIPAFSPEYDDCARIAAARSVPLREVYEAAQAAYSSQGKNSPETAAADHTHH